MIHTFLVVIRHRIDRERPGSRTRPRQPGAFFLLGLPASGVDVFSVTRRRIASAIQIVKVSPASARA